MRQVNKEELAADIAKIQSGKLSSEEIDAIMAKYQDALNEMEAEEAAAKETPDVSFTVKMIKDYILGMKGENHPAETVVQDRKAEKTPDSLKVKTCNLALLYGQDGKCSLLIRLPEDAAEKAKNDHSATASGFAGTHDYYKLPLEKSFKSEDELWEILEASYAYIISKYFKVENGEYVEIAPAEEPEAPTEEEVAEEAAPAEEPAEEAQEAEEPEETEAPAAGPVIGPNGEKIYITKTFTERLCLADAELLEKYSNLKNEFLSFRKVHTRVSKSNDAFRFEGNLIGKITVAGKGLKVYLALDPLSVDSAIYHQRDASSKKKFVATPLVVKVKSPLSYRKAIQLIDLACEKIGTVKKSRYEPQDWTKPVVKADK